MDGPGVRSGTGRGGVAEESVHLKANVVVQEFSTRVLETVNLSLVKEVGRSSLVHHPFRPDRRRAGRGRDLV